MIAGRCECGQILEWVARNADEHMRCFRLRWCGVCGEVARINKNCRFCLRRTTRAYMRRQRRLRSAVYLRNKAAKRLRYATDHAYAATCRRKDSAQKARRRDRQREALIPPDIEAVLLLETLGRPIAQPAHSAIA